MYKLLNNEGFLTSIRAFYFVALISFTVSLLLNQPEYFNNQRWGIILIDAITIFIVYVALLLYLKNIIGLRLNCVFLIYGTIINISLSTWYYFYHDIYFSSNFLFGTFIFCIYIVIAGFCIGHKQVFVISGFYMIFFFPLIFISGDTYLINNVIVLPFLVIAFSFAISAFLYLFESSHNRELGLKEKLYNKDKLLFSEKNHRLTSELENKKRELMAKTMFLLKHTENFNSFVKELNILKGGIKNSEQRLLNTIIQKHRLEQYNSYFKEFKTIFLEIHPQFHRKLYQACPLLSPSEYKLADLLHLGLSSKQIADITSVTPESVDVARSRLRKKLKLSSETKLTTYLLAL